MFSLIQEIQKLDLKNDWNIWCKNEYIGYTISFNITKRKQSLSSLVLLLYFKLEINIDIRGGS